MLSHKLMQTVDDHWEQITHKVIRELRHDPALTHIGKLPESELEGWGRDILKNLGHWLGPNRDESLERHFEQLGRLRMIEAVPLREAVRGVHILKERVLEFLRDHGFAQNAVEIYAEEEMEHRIGKFFDWVVYHLVAGYEEALRAAAFPPEAQVHRNQSRHTER